MTYIYNVQEEYLKNLKLENEQNKLKLENANLKYELKYKIYSFEKKIKSEIEKRSNKTGRQYGPCLNQDYITL